MSTAFPLQLHSVLDRGVPNEERINFIAAEDIDPRTYCLAVGIKLGTGRVVPFYDHFFWFGAGYVKAGDWIVVKTGTGQSLTEKHQDGIGTVYWVHWGRSDVLFTHGDIVPILFRMEDIQIGKVVPPPPATHPSQLLGR